MASYSIITDTLTVSPPLNSRERAYLRRLNGSAPVGTPGSHCPWEPSDDGTTLTIFEEFGTKQPVAEWTAYLAGHLLGPTGPERSGRRLKGFTYDHTLRGDVRVQGMGHGDVWTLRCRGDGITVHRDSMPCASCWAGALVGYRPTCAYRFIHPVHEANLLDGHDVYFDHDGMEELCPVTHVVPGRADHPGGDLAVAAPLLRGLVDRPGPDPRREALQLPGHPERCHGHRLPLSWLSIGTKNGCGTF